MVACGQQRGDIARGVLFGTQCELDSRLRLEQCDDRLLVPLGTESVERQRELLVDILKRSVMFRGGNLRVWDIRPSRPFVMESAGPAVSQRAEGDRTHRDHDNGAHHREGNCAMRSSPRRLRA